MTTEIDLTTSIRHDLFAEIRYEKRGKKVAVIGLKLDGHFVFKWIFQDAWKYISAGIVNADRDKLHSTESLFNNPTAWESYGEKRKGTHIAIGRCLAYFVRRNMLPLERFNPHQTNALYRFIGQ